MPQPSHQRSNDVPALLGGTPVRPEGPPDWPGNNPAVTEALQRAAADGSWGKYHGPHCERLIDALKQMHGCEHARLCSSGTVAVELALRGLKVGPGDEVVLAAYDFKGNFANVLAVGATPVLVDVRPDDWQFDAEQLQNALSNKTKAILVSHLHGGIVDMPRVREIARRGNLPVIEDVCQSPGAKVHGEVAGRWGDVAVLSFGGSKLLTAGRGGAILTHEPDLLQRVRLYTHRGNEAYPLSELQAAVLLPQLDQLAERNRKRTAGVALLLERLAGSAGLIPFRNADANSEPGYYKLGFQYDRQAFGGLSRDDFACAMRAEGIAIDPGFRALHRTHGRRRFRAVGELPVATSADDGVLVLHHPVLLEEEPAIEQIADAVEKIRRNADRLAARS